jgi:MFS family permease
MFTTSLSYAALLLCCLSYPHALWLQCADVGRPAQKRAESTAEADRARMLGYVGLAYGVGFLVGPGLGGMVSSGHLQNSAWLATLGSLVSMAMVLRYLPASRTLAPRPPPKADGGGMDDGSGRPTATRPVSRFDLREMHRVCTIKGVPSLLAVKLLSGLGSGLFHAIFALVAEERFQLTPGETGLVMSFVGGLTMLSQVSPASKKATCT